MGNTKESHTFNKIDELFFLLPLGFEIESMLSNKNIIFIEDGIITYESSMFS